MQTALAGHLRLQLGTAALSAEPPEATVQQSTTAVLASGASECSKSFAGSLPGASKAGTGLQRRKKCAVNTDTTWNHVNAAPYDTLRTTEGRLMARLGLERCVRLELKPAEAGLLPAPQAGVEGTWQLQTGPYVSAYVTVWHP